MKPNNRAMPRIGVIHRSLRLVWRAAPRQISLVFLLEIVAAMMIATQLLLARAVLASGFEGGDGAASLNGVIPELLLLVGLTAFSGLVTSASSARKRLIALRVGRAALDRVLQRAVSVELEQFDDPDFHDHMQRAEEAAEFRPWQLASGLLGSVSSIVGSVGIVSAMVVVEPWLAPFALLAYLPLAVVMRRNAQGILRVAIEHTDEDRERSYLQGLMTDRRAAPELRNYRMGSPLMARHSALYDSHMHRQQRLLRQHLRRSALANLVSGVIVVSAIGLLAMLANRGNQVNLSDAVIAAVAIAQLGARLRSLSTSGATLHEATLFLDDYFEFSPEDSTQDPHHSENPDVPTLDHLHLKGVSFTYPQAAEPTISRVDLSVRCGEFIAVVGASGSGKSTLIKMMCGLLSPTEGLIHWNGSDMADLGADAIAEQVTAVFQDYSKLELSARLNLAAAELWRANDDAALESATTTVGLARLVAGLPHGYETLLSPSYDRGVDLSEGQWQRVAVARALFRRPSLILLDEPTASLDARSERQVLEAFRARHLQSTVVLVTHRIANASLADRVVVFDDGRIVEDGTPAGLQKNNGIFAEFAALQGVTF